MDRTNKSAGQYSQSNYIESTQEKAHESALRIQSILPLSSPQKALWIHGQRAGEESSAVLHVHLKIEGQIDPNLLSIAWTQTQRQFEMLRATVHPHPKHEALLTCHAEIPAEFTTDDLSDLNASQQELHLETFLTNDRNRGIELDQAPTSRLHWVLLTKNTNLLIWTCHHLLLDGWSAALVINALLQNYQQYNPEKTETARELLPVGHYRERLKRFPTESAIQFWRNQLTGIEEPTLLCSRSGVSNKSILAAVSSEEMDIDQSNTIQEFCQRNGLTLGTLAQSAWALIVATLCQQSKVCVGLTVSGRPATLAGSETVVGNLANLIPLCVNLDSNSNCIDWMKTLQSSQFAMQEYDYLPYLDLLELGEPGCRNGYFDALLMMENLPAIQVADDDQLKIIEYRSDITSAYPLNLIVQPNKQWSIQCTFDSSQFSHAWITSILALMQRTLTALTASAEGCSLHLVQDIVVQHSPGHPNENTTSLRSYKEAIVTDVLDSFSGPESRNDFDMLRLFGEVLLETPMDMNAKFFDLGGNSLSALKLIARIESHFGVRLSVVSLLDNSTPRALVRLLKNEPKDKEPVPSLIALQKQGNEQALFCLHAGGGHALFYRDFALRLDGDRPVYALQPRGIDGFEAPLQTIEAMAQHYVEEIRRIQPEGPYHLLGYCFSAAALLPEMSRILNQSQQPVGHLIVVDSRPPILRSHPMSRFGWSAYTRYEYLRLNPWRQSLREVVRPARWVQLVNELGLKLKAVTTLRRNPVKDTSSASKPSHLNKVQQACNGAADSYRAEPMPFKINLLTTVDSDGVQLNRLEQINWHSVASEVETHELKTHHRDLFLEPKVREISQCVREILSIHSANV